MATYLPSIQDFVPQIQPFQPDLNFYKYALDTKEAQYKEGHDKISNLYGTLLNSELLREPDREKRDKFFTQVQNDIQRLSTVDLSLEENVDSAYKVFQPLIEDRNITKDMAWTKRYRAEQGKGKQLRNCLDKDCGGLKGWDEGDRALNYMAEDFSKADDQTAMGMNAPSYAPKVDDTKIAMDLFKKEGFDVQSVHHDRSGNWMVITKDGDQMILPLFHFAVDSIGSDPTVIDMYNTQAFVARKDYMKSNADTHPGGEAGAERDFLQKAQGEIDQWNTRVANEARGIERTLSTKKDVLNNKFKGGIDPKLQPGVLNRVADTLRQLGVATKSAAIHSETTNMIAPSETQGVDLDNLRWRIDHAYGRTLLSQKMHATADQYAQLHRTEKWEADPFAMENLRFGHDINKLGREQDFKLTEDKIQHEYRMAEKGQTLQKTPFNPRPLSPEEIGAGATALQPLSESNAEIKQYMNTGLHDGQQKVIDAVVNAYRARANNNTDPKAKEHAQSALNYILGPQAMAGGKKSPGYLANPDKDHEWHPDYVGNVYSRALSISKSDKDLLPEDQFVKVNKLQQNVDHYQQAASVLHTDQNENYGKIAEYIRSQRTNEYSADADLMMDPAKNYNPGYFHTAYIARHAGEGKSRERLLADADNAYNTISKDITKYYNNNAILGLKPFSTSAFMSTGGGGLQRGGAQFNIDPVTASQDALIVHEGLKQNANTPESIIVSGNIRDTGTKSPDNLVTSERAKSLLDLYFQEFDKDYKLTDTKRPKATITYAGGALGSKDWIATTYEIDTAMLSKYKGSKASPGIAYDLWDASAGKWNNQVTVYTPRDKAADVLTQTSKVTPEEILINHGYDITAYSDGGGTVSLKRNPDGSITGDSQLIFVSDDGTLKTDSRPITANNVDAATFISGVNQKLEALQTYNKLTQKLYIDRSDKKVTIAQIEQAILQKYPNLAKAIQ